MEGIVRLSYAKPISVHNKEPWDRGVFEASYREFLIQKQQFDPENQFLTFSDLKANIPKIENFQYLVSTSVAGYIQDLKELIPYVKDSTGKECLPFKNYIFDLRESDYTDRRNHKISIIFISEPVLLVGNIGVYLLVCPVGDKEDLEKSREMSTTTLEMIPGLGIYSFQKILK